MNDHKAAYEAERSRRQELRAHAESLIQELEDCKGLREFLLHAPTFQSLSLVQFDGLNGHRILSRMSLTGWKGIPHEDEILAYRVLLLRTLNRWELALNLPVTRPEELPIWPDHPPEAVLMA